MRFLVQWVVSEKRGKSVIPIYFWYLSLFGGLTLLTYAIHIKDPVFIVGQSMGAFIYIRNLMLIYKNKKKVVEV
ncbi:MAG: lipid-A-disaccharide synthase N-terminal domain-containing protein [Deltaproteobacteria bacterium]|nr:MAG: lipid-A-disaccharide synthase N-terminal domain-containing protein [Deltaproteobacteria bacterium]